ncbi:hypothetical protein ACIA8E_20545 [Streptomyces sp. NPDC051664]|uniref:hypothetical protein n=1 Tax=Streptomyces sp. NPDC051664 TaxID=3365668 RepID=UPI0037AF18C8
MGTPLSPLPRPLWTDDLLEKRRALYGTVGPGGSLLGRRMQPRNEKFFTFFEPLPADDQPESAHPSGGCLRPGP